MPQDIAKVRQKLTKMATGRATFFVSAVLIRVFLMDFFTNSKSGLVACQEWVKRKTSGQENPARGHGEPCPYISRRILPRAREAKMPAKHRQAKMIKATLKLCMNASGFSDVICVLPM